MKEKVPVSVVVLTKNEQARIARCLDSVKWADEIIVVDDESTDQTREIVSKYTDRIFVRKMEVEGRHRNWAYAQAKNNWILSLDSDEVVTPELSEEIRRVVSDNPKENGFTIPRRNYIGGYWVKYGGWYPSPQLRLFKKDKFRYEEVAVHPRAFMDDPCGHLKSDIIHYSYKNLEDFLAKLNNQTTREAQKWFAQNRPMRLYIFLWRSFDRFIRTYIVRKGYKDGFIGFIIAFYASLYQLMSYIKYRELIFKKSGKTFKMPAARAVFLDRDGVVNQYPGDLKYVTSWEDFHFLPRVKVALKKITETGYRIFIVSNQAGISKGIYSQEALDLITRNMLVELSKSGIRISGVYYCIHRPEDNCGCRKPKAGLVKKAIAKLKAEGSDIELRESFFIGDSIRDIETGKAAGLKTILVFSGKEKPENKNNWQSFPDFAARDLFEATDIINR